jgi:hypothetical protein
MDASQKHLADRILKLLALAQSTTFAAEAETARRLAEELMKTHNVQVGKLGQDAIEHRIYIPFAKGMRWEGIIAGALGDLCSCQIFFTPDKLDNYSLVGTTGTLDMLEYMLHEVNRQRMAAWLKYNGSSGPDSFNKFCYGFAMALKAKIIRLVDYGRVVEEQKPLTLWYETNIIHKSTNSTNLSSGRASSDAGLEAGKNASLHRGAVGQAAQKRLR